MKNSCIIACELHDYIEIACLYGYRVKLQLRNHQTVEGKAIDITSSENREYLVIDNDTRQHIDLSALAKLTVLTPKAKFSEVVF